MRTKIGSVTIDDALYPGEDLYCDGAVEDELLELVSHHSESEFNRIIVEKRSWPIMYHLSHVRENIVSWLPIEKTDSVLEIGSGCGAVTGALARKAKEVTCIELSRKRSLINANRHRDMDNIEILLGNFEAVEETLTKQYDWITLIGVLEYGGSYIEAAEPYKAFLQIIAKHLAPDGKIVVAIENKMGMKYWAGCKEDHLSSYYAGIEGYENVGSVRTFSKPELAQLVKEAGFSRVTYYYPYPDYKFAASIYSDDFLPAPGDLSDNLRNFDNERMLTFDESKTFDSVIRDGMFPYYSNSFELILQK
jgi:precorrin-6B methylase 2